MKLSRTILSTGLLLLIVISGTNFIVGVHYCGGTVQNVSLFSEADGCDKEKQLPPCHRHLKPACCQDEVVYHEAQDFKKSINEFQFENSFSTDVILPVLISNIKAPTVKRQYDSYYDPPLRTCDLNVKLRVFLI